jgi:hypothetical protein
LNRGLSEAFTVNCCQILFAAVNHSTVEKCKATNFGIGSDGFRVDQCSNKFRKFEETFFL